MGWEIYHQMNNGKQKVFIKLQTKINDQDQNETTTSNHYGTLLRRGKREVLLFNETTDDGRNITNFITLQENKVSIKRSGSVSMHQQFVVGKRTETMYEHIHGTIHLETYTKRLIYEPAENSAGGTLNIDYTVLLNGQIERQHKLVLTYQEEDYS